MNDILIFLRSERISRDDEFQPLFALSIGTLHAIYTLYVLAFSVMRSFRHKNQLEEEYSLCGVN